MNTFSRRKMLATGLATLALGTASNTSANAANSDQQSPKNKPYFILNTGTLLGFNLSVEEEIDLAAKTGYQGIELWLSKIQQYLDAGGNLNDLKKRLEDTGVPLICAIGFANWLGDNEEQRQQGIELMRREMEILAKLGCPYIAAPPVGAYDKRIDDLELCGQRYATILKIGESIGVIPLLELWGRSQTLSRLSDAVAIAVAAAHPKASLLLDIFHLFRGGNAFESLLQINGKSMHVFHLNDYPAQPERERQTDGDRIFPGDGVCPFPLVMKYLKEIGFCGAFSLELFNRTYWETSDPLTVAKTGMERMRAVCSWENQ